MATRPHPPRKSARHPRSGDHQPVPASGDPNAPTGNAESHPTDGPQFNQPDTTQDSGYIRGQASV